MQEGVRPHEIRRRFTVRIITRLEGFDFRLGCQFKSLRNRLVEIFEVTLGKDLRKINEGLEDLPEFLGIPGYGVDALFCSF